MPAPRSQFLSMLRAYFYSGWAFLIPYLAVYLLYYATNWPVNPAGKTQNPELQISNSWVPCMLHVYWALHATHAILAGFALWSWWKHISAKDQTPSTKCQKSERSSSDETGVLHEETVQTETEHIPTPLPQLTPVEAEQFDIQPDSLSVKRSALNVERSISPESPLLTTDSWLLTPLILRLLPWTLLALLFYIPGVYLEWPSDPWEHLRRINEWRILDNVGAHSSWMKYAYFIPYSLLSWCIGLRQLFWLDFYYTGICLLLCWQYYRFSRACGLGERASMVFVIIQALLFGNNIFSFYRYYGISSSIYAQLGAVALTRIFLEWAARGTKLDADHFRFVSQRGMSSDTEITEPKDTATQAGTTQSDEPLVELEKSQDRAQQPNSLSALFTPLRALCVRALCTLWQKTETDAQSFSFWHPPSILRLLAPSTLLLALTALNHPQGLGIAGIGIVAIIIWRLIEWKRSALWWLIGGTIVINALFLALYHRPAIIDTYRAQGYLNAWYGFNILDLCSPAGDRILQILGVFGLINLAVALMILHGNQLIAWLTLFPLIALELPCFATPFAQMAFQAGGESNIVVFQRLLFAVPHCLTLVYFGSRLGRPLRSYFVSSKVQPGETTIDNRLKGNYALALACIILTTLILIPNSSQGYNRQWNMSSTVPADLQLRSVWAKYGNVRAKLNYPCQTLIVSNEGASAVISTAFDSSPISSFRAIGLPATAFLNKTFDLLELSAHEQECRKILNMFSSDNRSQASKGSHISGIQQAISDAVRIDQRIWITVSGQPPEFLERNNVSSSSKVLQNSAGAKCEIFASTLVPIKKRNAYRLEMTIRDIHTVGAVAYLAVAWYDNKGTLLVSNTPSPLGAGNPRGWSNGTYSYFGLTPARAPSVWTTYSVTFGLTEAFGIPHQACFFKVGALLNYNEIPEATIQLTNVKLKEMMPSSPALLLPGKASLYSSVSQAGLLSTHWPAQQVAVEHGGTEEIRAALVLLENKRTSDE